MRAQKPELVTAPATDLLALDEVKEFLRIELDEIGEDALLASLILAATATLDGYSGLLGRALITQVWQQKLDDFPHGSRIAIPLGKVQSVDAVTYIDELGGNASFTDFHLVDDPIGPGIWLDDNATWPSTAVRPDAITIRWTAGYGDSPGDVPELIRLTALQLIAHWYATREAVNVGNIVSEVPWGVRQAIGTLRAFGG